MNGNFSRLASEAHEWKNRREECVRGGGASNREVALAQEGEQFLNQFAADNDEGMLQIALIQAYQTHLGVDILDQGVDESPLRPPVDPPQLAPSTLEPPLANSSNRPNNPMQNGSIRLQTVPELSSRERSMNSSDPASQQRNGNPPPRATNFLGVDQGRGQAGPQVQRSIHTIEDPSFGFNDQSNFRNPQEISIVRDEHVIPASPQRSPPHYDIRLEEPPMEECPSPPAQPVKSPALKAQLISLKPSEGSSATARINLEDSTQGVWNEFEKMASNVKPQPRQPEKAIAKDSHIFRDTVELHAKTLAEAAKQRTALSEKKQELEMPKASQLFPGHLKTVESSSLNAFAGGNALMNLFTPELLEKATALDKRKQDMADVTEQDKENLHQLRAEIKAAIENRRKKPLASIADALAHEPTQAIADCLAWVDTTEQNTISARVRYLRMVEHAVAMNREMADQVVKCETLELETATLEAERKAAEEETKKMSEQRDQLLQKLDRQRREIDSLHEESVSTQSDSQKQKSVTAKIQVYEKLLSMKRRELENLRDHYKRTEKVHEDYKLDLMLYYRRTGQPVETLGMDFGKSLEKLLSTTVKQNAIPTRY